MEKRNSIFEKRAVGDASSIDDIVEGAEAVLSAVPRRRRVRKPEDPFDPGYVREDECAIAPRP